MTTINKYGLLGKTLKHSFSKVIHEYLYNKYQIEAKYDLIEIEEENIEDALENLRNSNYLGYNVTIPYKEKVIEYLDEVSLEVKAIGACNMIKCCNGKLIGYNTDYFGFYNLIKYYKIDLTNTVYILGSGGASKSIAYALNKLNKKSIVVSRKKDYNKISYDDLYVSYKDEYIINTTPVGMYPHINESIVDYDLACRANGIVDIIYNPDVTLLMSYNENSYNGLMMLIFQAVKAFEIWTNISVIVDDKMIRDIKTLIGVK